MTGARRVLMAAAVAALCAGAAVAACPTGTTHIVDTLTAADGSAKVGTIYVTGPNGVTSLARSTVPVTIGSGGAVDFCLVGGPAYLYEAEYRLTASGRALPSYTERWFVPARSVGTMTIQQLWGGSGVPYFLVSPQQVSTAGLEAGQMWIYDGDSFIPGAPLFADTLTAQLGDLAYRGASGWSKLSGNTLAAKRFLCQLGTGTVSAAPDWCAIGSTDLPAATTSTAGAVTTTTSSSQVVSTDDPRNSDARTPVTHATTHKGDGSDPIAAASTTVRGTVTTTTSSSQVVSTDDPRNTNARTPTVHASTHATGNTDPVTPAAIGAIATSAAPVGAIVGTTDSQTVTDKLLGRTETAGAGGVVAKLLAVADATNPGRYVLPAAGGCGSGIAGSTVSSGSTFFLYAVGGQTIAALADGTITAGHLVTGGSSTPGRVADTGQTLRSAVPSSTCIVGVAVASATVGATVFVIYDGPGSYGSGSFSDDGSTITMASGRSVAICTTLPCTTNTGAVLRTDTGVSGMGGGLSGVRSNLTMWSGVSEPSCSSVDAPNNTCGPGGAQLAADSFTYAQIIALWDYFLTANLAGVTATKAQIGTDQSGAYPIWAFTLTPQSYDRTVILSAGQHFEPAGVVGLWRFMYHALGSSDPAFAPMRSVRYIVLPASNAWGWSTIAAPNRGLNSRGVNLNHNHSYAAFWNISVSSDKGSAPNSEAETVALDALLASSGASALLDCHDYGPDTSAGHDIDIFAPPYILSNGTTSGLWPDYSAVNALVQYLSTSTSTTLISTNNYEASLYSTAASSGIQAFNLEGSMNFGGALHSYLGSDYMTHYVKEIGNAVLALSQLGPNQAHGIKRSDLPAPMFAPVQVLPSSVTTSRLMSFRNATGEAVASSVTDNGSSVYTSEKFGAGTSFSADPASPVQASADLNAANSSNPANYHFFVHAPTAANTEIGMCFGYTWTYKCNAAITHKFQGTGFGDLYFYTANSSGTWGKRLGIFASGGASLGSTTDPGSGIFNAANGFYQGGVALASTHLSDTASLIRTTDLAAWTGSTNLTTIGTQTTPTEWQTNTDSFGQNTASGFALVAHTNNNTNGSAEAGIAFGVSTTASVIGGAVTLERLGSGSYGNLWFYTKNSSQTFARRVGFMSSGGVTIGGSTDPGSGNLIVSGTIAPLAGTNTLYRCTVAGTLRVGEFTTVSADCGTAVDTGMRVQ